jgi:hypothetical protein
MVSKGKTPVRSKTILDDQILEQINFNYVGHDMSYDYDKDIDNINEVPNLWSNTKNIK